jgi:hypothetical protein
MSTARSAQTAAGQPIERTPAWPRLAKSFPGTVEGAGDLAARRSEWTSSEIGYDPHELLLARVAELADAQDSGSCARKGVRVQVPPRAPRLTSPFRSAAIEATAPGSRLHPFCNRTHGYETASGVTHTNQASPRRFERAATGRRDYIAPKISCAPTSAALLEQRRESLRMDRHAVLPAEDVVALVLIGRSAGEPLLHLRHSMRSQNSDRPRVEGDGACTLVGLRGQRHHLVVRDGPYLANAQLQGLEV